jgi:hypothetical protein
MEDGDKYGNENEKLWNESEAQSFLHKRKSNQNDLFP